MALWGRNALPRGLVRFAFSVVCKAGSKISTLPSMVVYRVMLWWMFRTSPKSVLIVKLIISPSLEVG